MEQRHGENTRMEGWRMENGPWTKKIQKHGENIRTKDRENPRWGWKRKHRCPHGCILTVESDKPDGVSSD
jgi:hypothetical protein